MGENNYFETTDISLASAIVTFGGKIDAIDKADPYRSVFVFKRSKELDALIQGFWAHSLSVDPLAYFNCLKEVKNRLYQTIG
ncbi:MAG: DUF5659 domain-containing protein [Minisyncoccia bacterium]